MNALVKKEIRLLLPSFLIGCVAALSNGMSLWRDNPVLASILYLIPFVVCPAVGVMIALQSFGGEISSGTLASLLAQPVSRLKIWQAKILSLVVALVVVTILWLGAFLYARSFSAGAHNNSGNFYDLFVCAVVFALVVFSGGLWTVLLLRQVAAAFWFTLLVPGVVMMIVVGFFGGDSGEFFTGILVSVLGVYSLAGFFFARWLFLRAQDVQWSGGTIAMPEIRGLPVWFSRSATGRVRRPRAALWRKEIQLHQSQFIMAFALLLLHLMVIAARHFCDLRNSSDLKFILEIFWGLWLVMPLLVGCAAVAEERKLGTLEGQLCLPVKKRTQFRIKFFVVLILSLLLGAVMPLLLEGTRILPNVHLELRGLGSNWYGQLSTGQIFFVNCLQIFSGLLPLLLWASIVLVIGVISFFISSLMRNTLQTLAPAVLGILLTWFLLWVVSDLRSFDLELLWRGPLPYLVGGPLMLLVLLRLTFQNFQHVRMGWKVCAKNIFLLALALVLSVTATTAVYHRCWEKLTPFEPPHGVARLDRSNPASLKMTWNEISARLPDGRIWMNYFVPNPTAFNPLAIMFGNLKAKVDKGKYLNGSDWLAVNDVVMSGLVGIKTDGSLWVSEKLWQTNRSQNGKRLFDRAANQYLVPFGKETNWNSFVPDGLSVLLVKNDGTLWRWGAHANFDLKHHEWPGLPSFTPYQLGTETNWAKIYQADRQSFLRKTDSSLWTWNDNWNTNHETLVQLEPGFVIQSVKNLGRDKFRSVAQISYGLQFNVGVSGDGTFRIWADQHMALDKKTRIGNYQWFPADVAIGDGTNWVAVAGSGEQIVTLKADGSLWLWHFHLRGRQIDWNIDHFEREIKNQHPVRLGTHSDWIAISGIGGNVGALAADGSLWFWPLRDERYFGESNGTLLFNNDNLSFMQLLDISHKPQLLANVFDVAK